MEPNITKRTTWQVAGKEVIVEEADNYDGYAWRLVVDGVADDWYPGLATLVMFDGIICLTSCYTDDLHHVPFPITPGKKVKTEDVNPPNGRDEDITKD